MNFFNKKLFSYSTSVKFYLIGTFISSIGDGMFSLAVSKLAFDKTGTVAGVGGVIIIQSITTFSLNLLAGYVADAYDSKKISIYSDLIQAILIILYAFSLIYLNGESLLLFLLTTVISCISPFFRAANFKLLPEIDRKDLSLVKLNGLRSSVKQGGLLLGSTLIAPFIFFNLLPLTFLLNGISFLISCLCTYRVILTSTTKEGRIGPLSKISEIYKSWFSLVKELFLNHKVFFLVLFSTFDYLIINFINLIGIKYAETVLHNSAFISLIDGGYAAGAIISFLLINIVFSKCDFNYILWIGLFVQGITIILMNYFSTAYSTFILIFIIGVFTGTSISLFQTILHKGISQKFHGKISSFRDMMVSGETLCIIPIFSYIINFDFKRGILIFGILILTLSSILAWLGLTKYFPSIKLRENGE